MASALYRIDVKTATIGGESIQGLVSLNVVAQANGIPYVTLVVDARNPGGKSPGTAVAASTDAAIGALQEFQGKRDKGETLTLNVVVTPLSGDGSAILSLRGWPLEDVILSPLTVGACTSVSLTCRHPICRADNGGTIPDDFTSPVPDTDIKGSNPVEAFLSSLSAYATAALAVKPPDADVSDNNGSPTIQKVRTALVQRLKEGISTLEKHVSVSVGFPAATLTSGIPSRQLAFKPYAARACGILRPLLTSVIPDCSLVLGGDFTQTALTIKAHTPWATPSTSILETEIEHLRLPGADQAPLLGVGLDILSRVSDGNCSFITDLSGANLKRTPVTYVPQPVLSSPRVGPLQWYSPPAWIESMRALASCATSSKSGASLLDKNGKYKSAENYSGGPLGGGGGDAKLHTDIGGAAMALAHALYDTTYRSTLVFHAVLRFRPDIFPGTTVGIKTVSANGVASDVNAVRGYVLAVSSAIDIRSKSASTELTLSYPVFADKVPKEIIDGNKNALY